MKVKCIDKDGWKNLTIGKTYEVIREDEDCVCLIIDDRGYECWFFKTCFKPLSELRNETINKLLGI